MFSLLNQDIQNVIVFDLEWNQSGYNPNHRMPHEIIEIGACRVDREGHVVSRFSELIRPRVYKRLDKHIKQVTGITEQELAEAKRGLIEYRAVNRAQDGTLAGSWINFMESGRDWSFSKDMEVAIEKLTVKDVNAAIRRIADPSKMTFVLAADLAKAREAGKDFSKQ